MGVVAVGAGHLPLGQRVGAALVHLRPLLLVAVHTNVNLSIFVHHLIAWRMNTVTTRATYPGKLVGAPQPMRALTGLVTIEADGILLRNRRLGAKGNSRLRRFAATVVSEMLRARAVTALTTLGRHGRLGIGLLTMHCGQDASRGFHTVLAVTAQATLRVTWGVARLGANQ